jgi:hypothetical protein
LRIVIGIILLLLISAGAAAADLESSPQTGEASIIKSRPFARRLDVPRQLSHCKPCRHLPWGGLLKVRKTHVPFGGLRPAYVAGLPWGGLVESCPPRASVRRVVLVRKGELRM